MELYSFLMSKKTVWLHKLDYKYVNLLAKVETKTKYCIQKALLAQKLSSFLAVNAKSYEY